jgi:pyruvate/2-oxoglutarate dehydrogenase complex dihydrolipoamide acyltransferase (E2) component
MPQLGETVAEGKITKWFKAAGDAVKPGDNLFEIETDKTSMEVPSINKRYALRNTFQVGDGRQGRRCGGGDFGAR